MHMFMLLTTVHSFLCYMWEMSGVAFRVRLPAAWQHSGFVSLVELDAVNFLDAPV